MEARYLGHAQARAHLRRMVESRRLHPCLLWEGPEGVGKRTTAIWLAMLANCEADEQSLRPCGGCWSCRQIPKGQHPDVMTVGLDPGKTAPIISVGQARDVIGQLTVKPFHARLRFVIIDPADAMTPEAANALLKTFEDPPAQTHFILVTSAPASLLLTVRSRSQRLRFAPVSDSEIAEWLREQGFDGVEARTRAAEGCPGKALSLDMDDADGVVAARDLFLAALDMDLSGRQKYTETLCRGDRSKWAPAVNDTLDAIAGLLRDALSVRSGGQIFYNQDCPTVVDQWAKRLSPSDMGAITVDLARAHERLGRFVSGRLVMDALIADVYGRTRGNHVL